MSRPGAISMTWAATSLRGSRPADPGAEVAHGLRLQLVEEDERAQLGHRSAPTSCASSSTISAPDLLPQRQALRRDASPPRAGCARLPVAAAAAAAAPRRFDANGYGGTGPAGACHGIRPGEVAERLGRIAL